MKAPVLQALLLVLLVLLPFVLDWQESIIREPSRVKTASLPKRGQSKAYDFSIVDSRIKNSRPALAACLWKDSNQASQHLKLQFNWAANGRLISVMSDPAQSSAITQCLEVLVNSWKLPHHPALKPFSYSIPVNL